MKKSKLIVLILLISVCSLFVFVSCNNGDGVVLIDSISLEKSR